MWYKPRHWHHVFPVLTILLGFWLTQRYGKDWTTAVSLVALALAGLLHGYYIMQASIIYQKYVARIETPTKSEAEYIEQYKVPDLNEPVMAQDTVPLPTFNKERNYAVTLLRMKEYGKVDMTENKWVKTGKFTRHEYKAMLDKWAKYDIIGREANRANASYEVKNWNGVRMIAEGEVLPND